jgi:TPR repeat protein
LHNVDERIWHFNMPKSRKSGAPSRAHRLAHQTETQKQIVEAAEALAAALRGATIVVGAAAESSTSTTRGRQAADDSPPARGRKRRSPTPESREADAARKQAARSKAAHGGLRAGAGRPEALTAHQETRKAQLELNAKQLWHVQNATREELKKKAEQGDVEAQYRVSLMYAPADYSKNNFYIVQRASIEEDQDHAKAVRWSLKAAKKGHVIAQCNLGSMYNKQQGVKQDHAEALLVVGGC